MDPILFAQAAADGNYQFIDKVLNPAVFVLLIPIVAIIGGISVGIVKIVAVQWRKAKKTEFELSLKSQMVAQGKSVEEIERVLNAGRSDRT